MRGVALVGFMAVACGDNHKVRVDAAIDSPADGSIDTPIDADACAQRAHCGVAACNAPTGCVIADTDGDGLNDAWEAAGYVDLDCDGAFGGPSVDIDLTGASPTEKDIFVYYNYMVPTGAAHTHQPPTAALDQVVAAFAAHNIHVHFVDGGPIAETAVTTLDPAPDPACAGSDVSTMPALRLAHLGNRALAYHYLVFAHRAVTPDASHALACPRDPRCNTLPLATSTGHAEIVGDDFIVSFGSQIDSGQTIEPFLVATTVMHELGHNLGLLHGGPDACVVNKPNYVSVMSPDTYQMNGIPIADAPGSANPRTCNSNADCDAGTYCTTGQDAILGYNYCYRLDYSTGNLTSLNELALDETAGVGGPATDTDLIFYFVPGGAQPLGPSNGSPIDWDNDGVIEASVSADINNDSSQTLLTTQDDWAKLVLPFQCD